MQRSYIMVITQNHQKYTIKNSNRNFIKWDSYLN